MTTITRMGSLVRKLSILLLVFNLSLQFSFAQGGKKTESKGGASFPSGEQFKNAKITYQIIPAANTTWCYDILVKGHLYIHQTNVPSLPGNEGFKTKEQAAKVAELVIRKMKKGEMPPSVTLDEMKKVGGL